MQAIMETLFDAAYLVTVVTLGSIMVKSAQDRETKLFGWMAVILGCGDALHLVPRAWALCTDGLAAHAAALGAGKFITSITMTIFYVILYHIGKRRYGLHIRALTGAVCALAAARDEFLQMGYSRRGECIAYVGGGYGFPYSTSYC